MDKKEQDSQAGEVIKDLDLEAADAESIRGGQLSARIVKPGAAPTWDLKAQKSS